MDRRSGRYITSTAGGETVQAWLPAPLPPEPPLALGGELLSLSEKANRLLGKLDAVTEAFADVHLFLYQYVRKEALLSSQIEGSRSSFADLLLYEMEQAPGVPVQDTEEVSNYVAALNHGMQRIENGFPLSLRLLKEMHGILLQGGRGKNKQPGEFRRSQNWLGGSRPGNAVFVPPPPDKLMEWLGPFELFLHAQAETMPVLIKAGLLHVQFETIHPFLDGNGRLGRLLITLLLCHDGILKSPVLYLSLYFKQNRAAYYDQLQQVRQKGDWEAWLEFFLTGVIETAEQAATTAYRITRLFQDDAKKISALGRIAKSCHRVHERLQEKTIINIQDTSRELGINRTTISRCMKLLIELGIVEELTGYRRNRLFTYKSYLGILSEGTEPL